MVVSQERPYVTIPKSVEAQRAALEPRICVRLLNAIQGRPTPCALLLGPSGAGKTSAAHWMLAGLRPLVQSALTGLETDNPRWLSRGPVEHMRARDLASSSRRHGLGDGFAPEVMRARGASVLSIDDIGSEGSEVAALQDVLDWRYEQGLPTIATSGLTKDQLLAHLGAAYLRRIVDQHVLRKDGAKFPVLISEEPSSE